MRVLVFVALIGVVAFEARAQECASGAWVEQELGSLQNGIAGALGPLGEVVIAPDGTVWAQAVQWRRSPSAYDLYVNGAKHATYAQVLPGTLGFAEKGHTWGVVVGAGVMMKAVFPSGEEEPYEAIGEAGIVFNPDGKRHAYSVGQQGQQLMVVDGRLSKLAFDAVTPPVWSPDGSHLAYVALSGQNQAVVMDDTVLGSFSSVLGMPLFSPDGKHVAFVAELPGKQTLFLDGKAALEASALADSCPTLSKAGWACPMKSDKGWSVAQGGYEGASSQQNLRTFEGFVNGSLVSSPDGNRWVYAVQEKGKTSLVVDGKPSEPFDRLERAPVFSGNGKRLGAVVEKDQGVFVWLDGKLLGPYESVSAVTFSPDASKVWFVAMKAGKVGLADEAGSPKEWCDGLSAPVFSPDGKEMAWVVLQGAEYHVVRNGVVDAVGMEAVADQTLSFSPDAKSLVVVGKKEGKPVVWANGCLSGPLDGLGMLDGLPLTFAVGDGPIVVGKRGVRMMKLQFKSK